MLFSLPKSVFTVSSEVPLAVGVRCCVCFLRFGAASAHTNIVTNSIIAATNARIISVVSLLTIIVNTTALLGEMIISRHRQY